MDPIAKHLPHAPGQKPAPADHPVADLIGRRWSPRAIDPDRPVSREAVLTLLEAARWAPSCSNEQPWRFLVFDGADPAALESARGCLKPGNAWARRAPVLLLTVACDAWNRSGGGPNRLAQHDVGLASENLALQATALGLVTHFMGGFYPDQARIAFAIPEGYTPMAMIAVGFPGDPALLSEEQQARESSPRQRKPLPEIAFAGTWLSPYSR